MSTDPTVTEVFAEIDPDPDAILEAHDAADLDALLAGGGEHDPRTDEAIDVDDVTAADVFADLQAAAREVTEDTTDRCDNRACDGASEPESDLELVGPGPTETRIPSDAFGAADADIDDEADTDTDDVLTDFCWDGSRTNGVVR